MILDIKFANFNLKSEDTTFVKFNKQLEEIILLAKMTDYEVKFENNQILREMIYEFQHNDICFGLIATYNRDEYIRLLRLKYYVDDDIGEAIGYTEIYEGERNFRVLEILDTLRERLIKN